MKVYNSSGKSNSVVFGGRNNSAGPSEIDCAFRKYNLRQLLFLSQFLKTAHFSSVKSSDFQASDRLVTG